MKLNANFTSFCEPSSRISYVHEKLEEASSTIKSSQHQKIIDTHHFNSKVLLLLPDAPSLPHKVKNIFEETVFYKISKLNIIDLCKHDFLQAFVQCGKVSAMSTGGLLDLENSCVFLPTGTLVVSLNRYDYQSLGLSGKPSTDILRKPLYKYLVEIDTCQAGYLPTKELYKKIQKSLSDFPILFDFYITWEPYNKEICPSSIAKYFSDLCYQVTESYPEFNHQTLDDIARLPSFGDMTNPADVEESLEWIGLASLGLDVASCDFEFDTSEAQGDRSDNTTLNISHIEGFFTPTDIKKLVKELRIWLSLREVNTVPWVIITVYGSPDTLVTWGQTENRYRFSGDNLYTLVIGRESTLAFKMEGFTKPLRFRSKTSNKK